MISKRNLTLKRSMPQGSYELAGILKHEEVTLKSNVFGQSGMSDLIVGDGRILA